MQEKPVFTSVQLLFMAVGSALVFPYTFMPILNAPPANQDMWAVLIMTFVYIFVINLPLLFLMNRYRGMNAVEIFETTLGKFFGKLALIPVVLFCIYCYTACMMITAIFINLYVMPDTPVFVLLLFMVIPISYTAFKGAGTIGRMAVFIVSVAIATIVIFFLLGIEQMDFNILRPAFADSTFLEMNIGAFYTGARYSEILIFFVFSYYLGKRASINKTYALTLGIFGLCFMLLLLPVMLTLGVEYAQHAWNPYFTYTRQLKLFDFLERMQAFNLITWFPTALLKLTIYNYMASFILSNIFRTKSHKGFVIPVSVVAFSACLLPVLNNSATIELLRSDKVFPYVIMPVIFVIPLIVVLVYLLRKKKIDSIIQQKRLYDAEISKQGS